MGNRGSFATHKTGVINKSVTSVLAVKHLHKTNPVYYTLEANDESPIFIPANITEDMVELLAWKFLGVWDLEVQTWRGR